MSEGTEPQTEASPAADPIAADEVAPADRRGGRWRPAWLAVLVLVVFAAGVALWPVILPRLGGVSLAPITVLESADLDARLGGLGERLDALERGLAAAEASLADEARRLDALQSDGDAAAEALAGTAGRANDALSEVRAQGRRIGDLEAETDALGALSARIAALEGALAEAFKEAQDDPDGAATLALQQRLDGIEAAIAAGAGGAAPPPGETRALAERLDALEARLGETLDIGETVAALGEDAARLGDRLGAGTARIEALEAAAAAGDPRRIDLVLAIGRLRQALSGSGPYADDLTLVVELGAGEPALGAALDTLAARADSGVPARSVLRARFALVARDAIQADRDSAAEDWLDKTVARLGRLVSVRRTGEVAGDATDAVLARAETRLAEDDLGAAVVELGALLGAAGAAAAEWLGDAEARLGVERALAELAAAAAQSGQG